MGKLIFHSEKDLLSQLAQGNQDAFDVIYNQYANDLYRYAYSRLGSQEDSEDLIQTVFTSLWERREHAKEITTLRYYLYCSVRYKLITLHTTVQELSKRKKDYADQATTLDNSNLEHQDLRDTKLIIERTIATLPERVQTAFRLSGKSCLNGELHAAVCQGNNRRSLLQKGVPALRT